MCWQIPHSSSYIVILIGADLFIQLMTGNKFSLGPGLLTGIRTPFGIVLMGFTSIHKFELNHIPANLILLLTKKIELNKTLNKLWQNEEPPTHNKVSNEHQFYEDYFKNTYSSDESGSNDSHLR